MTFPVVNIKAELENSLNKLSEWKGVEFTQRIKPILYTNLDRGRIQSFIEGNFKSIYDYVRRVADEYIKLSPLIEKLQIERTTTAWEPLFKKMVNWAFYFFIKKGFAADKTTQEIAMECATEAAMNILNAHFPYDTDLEPWVCVITHNACRRYIRRASKKSNVPPQNIINIDEMLSNIKDPNFQDQEYIKALQGDLLEAIAKLSSARRQVIEFVYFDELSPGEIAGRMGKSVGAIYSLQFNALQDLRKILSKNRNNINE
jgi:RNA polymerase sigma factor (sigma-70 family)